MTALRTAGGGQVPDTLLDLFRVEFDRPGLELSPHTRPGDVAGWDSVRMVNLVFAVEEAFGIVFTSIEMEQIGCVADFIRHLPGRDA